MHTLGFADSRGSCILPSMPEICFQVKTKRQKFQTLNYKAARSSHLETWPFTIFFIQCGLRGRADLAKLS